MDNNQIEIIHDTEKLNSFLGYNPILLKMYISEHEKLIKKEYPNENIVVRCGNIDCNTMIKMNGKEYNSNNIAKQKDENFIPENILFLEDQIDLCNLKNSLTT